MNSLGWQLGSSLEQLLDPSELELLSSLIDCGSVEGLTVDRLAPLSDLVRRRFILAFMPQLFVRDRKLLTLNLSKWYMGHKLQDELDVLLFLLGEASEYHFDPMVFNHPEARKQYEGLARSFISSYSKAVVAFCGLKRRADMQRDVSSVLAATLPLGDDGASPSLKRIVPHKIPVSGGMVSVLDESVDPSVNNAVLRGYEFLLRYAGLNDNSIDCTGHGVDPVFYEMLHTVLKEMEQRGLTVSGEVGSSKRCLVERYLLEHGCATDTIKRQYIATQTSNCTPERFLQAVASGESAIVVSMLDNIYRESGFDNCCNLLKSGLRQALLHGQREVFNYILGCLENSVSLTLESEDDYKKLHANRSV